MARATKQGGRSAGRRGAAGGTSSRRKAAGGTRTATRSRSASKRRSAPRDAASRGVAARGSSARGGTDAAHVLRRQHAHALELFRELAEASGEARRSTFQKLADALAAHATVEERLVYPELARHGEIGDLARDAVEEHLAAKRLLADMLEARLSDEVFDAKCRVLEDAVTRHLEEEEAVLLPQAERLLGRERLAELGPELERTFAELMQHEPRRNLPREAEGAPVLH